MDILYRQAEKSDTNAIADLAVKMWTKHTTKKLSEEFSEWIESNNNVIYVLMIDNAIQGFVQCGLRFDYVEGTNSSPVAYLEGICIDEKYRKHGYAKELVRHCEQWAKEKGCIELASDCESDNETSLLFHLNIGFKEVNRIICFKKDI